MGIALGAKTILGSEMMDNEPWGYVSRTRNSANSGREPPRTEYLNCRVSDTSPSGQVTIRNRVGRRGVHAREMNINCRPPDFRTEMRARTTRTALDAASSGQVRASSLLLTNGRPFVSDESMRDDVIENPRIWNWKV
ncbi:hypothetical protein OHA40_02845 [Nocardia sp. NBC_00508]|uniref:hypothetical protein n=1 Tax=Nocardia sp. NBC_00508 TaxID=2975992 RepID=UPI002E813FC7|nr:hypothetical protein [Nocardia sp. NBC_00508]WUD70217.1 hypothetical protein OHA40_02845 [Nocardia sp. NBC_00508]